MLLRKSQTLSLWGATWSLERHLPDRKGQRTSDPVIDILPSRPLVGDGFHFLSRDLHSDCQIAVTYLAMMISLFFVVLLSTLSFGRVVQFSLDLTWETYAPDGNPRQMVLMNGQFPGPQLNLDYGDDVEVCKVQVLYLLLAHWHCRLQCTTIFPRRQPFIFMVLSKWVLHGPMVFLGSLRSPFNRAESLYTDGRQPNTVRTGIMATYKVSSQTVFMGPLLSSTEFMLHIYKVYAD